jgi:hypothetical protein
MTMMTFSLHLNLPPVHPTPKAPNSFSLFKFTNKSYKFPHLPIRTLHHFVSVPLPLPQTQRRIHNLADFFVNSENYVFSRLRPGRQTTSLLLPSTIQYSIPAEQPSS